MSECSEEERTRNRSCHQASPEMSYKKKGGMHFILMKTSEQNQDQQEEVVENRFKVSLKKEIELLVPTK